MIYFKGPDSEVSQWAINSGSRNRTAAMSDSLSVGFAGHKGYNNSTFDTQQIEVDLLILYKRMTEMHGGELHQHLIAWIVKKNRLQRRDGWKRGNPASIFGKKRERIFYFSHGLF